MSLSHIKDKVRYWRILEATYKIHWLSNKMLYEV